LASILSFRPGWAENPNISDDETQQALSLLRDGPVMRQMGVIIREAVQKAPQNRVLRFLAETRLAAQERDKRLLVLLKSFEPLALAEKLDQPQEIVSKDRLRAFIYELETARSNALGGRDDFLQIYADETARVEKTVQEFGHSELINKFMAAWHEHKIKMDPLLHKTIDNMPGMYEVALDQARFRLDNFDQITSRPDGFEFGSPEVEQGFLKNQNAMEALGEKAVAIEYEAQQLLASWDKKQRELFGIVP